MRCFRSTSDWREDLFGDPKGAYISVCHDTKPGVFFGWTIYLGLQGKRVLFAHSAKSRTAAFIKFRYLISRIALTPQAKLSTVHSNPSRQDFSADFTGVTGLDKWYIRKTLYISLDKTAVSPTRYHYKLEWNPSHRNIHGEYAEVNPTPPIQMRLIGISIKDLQSQLRTIIPLCIKWCK